MLFNCNKNSDGTLSYTSSVSAGFDYLKRDHAKEAWKSTLAPTSNQACKSTLCLAQIESFCPWNVKLIIW